MSERSKSIKMAYKLLAENDESLRQFLAKALTRAGHEVVHCGDGKGALTWVDDRGSQFHLLLADGLAMSCCLCGPGFRVFDTPFNS